MQQQRRRQPESEMYVSMKSDAIYYTHVRTYISLFKVTKWKTHETSSFIQHYLTYIENFPLLGLYFVDMST